MSAILLIVAVVIVAIVVYNSNPASKEISYTQYTTMITSGNIKEISIENSKVNIISTDNERFWFYNRGEYLEEDLKSDVETFNYLVDTNSAYASYSKITLKYGTSSTFSVLDILFPLLSFGLMAFFVILLLKRIGKTNNQSFDFVKNRARIIPSNVKFDSVAGLDEEKEEVREIIEFLRNPKKFIDVGARIPKGVLLEGAPGTGKTLLAKAIAGEAEVPFFSISGSDFMELFVGVGASRVRDLFENAKKAKPCIVFIDEIDAVGRQRGTGMGGGNDEREQTLNQLLVQMDGFEENEGIIVIAATNRADILDPAILRPGRFDRRIHIHIPDVKGREEILKVHAKNKPLESNVDLQVVARITSGFTGADLENLLNESAIIAAKENRTKINMTDINNGIVKVTMGPQKRSRIVSEKDKRITAIHESGHAIIERLVENNNPVHEISIVPRGSAGGYTLSRPDNDDEYMSKSKLIDTITMMLGGRTAERMFIGDFTTGASNDIERATQIARKMVTEWGMSDEIGYVCLGSQTSYFLGRDYQERVNYSEKEAALIDAEVKKIMDSCAKKAEDIISKHKPELETMVSVLLEKETIYSDEINMIIEGKSKEEVIAFIDSKSAPKAEEKPEEKVEVKEDKTLDELLDKAKERKKSQTVPKNRPTNIKIEEEDQIKINELKASEQTKEVEEESQENMASEKPVKNKTEKPKKDAE
ncbi:MAG: ATP-dependent zinc metalloprotease FtsH [bacterium]|nr:ATP-dependent zinc metalloprotease FtsH [bacterium]